jgi:hypothetical protein
MLRKLPYTVSLKMIEQALNDLPSDNFRYTINEPNGNFFYNEWQLKSIFIDTVWESIYNSIPFPKGEARIIKLASSESYVSHSDIDDRYHLNLSGIKSFLIDLDNKILHQLNPDGQWYEMNAGIRHTAVNFGNRDRFQLVIRKPLITGNFKNPISISLTLAPGVDKEDARFLFDDIISPWLNKINKLGKMKNFNSKNGTVSFIIDYLEFVDLQNILPKEFEIK